MTKHKHPAGFDSGMQHFGYRESLNRGIGKFGSFAAGVSYISILTGTFQLFYFGFGAAGPAYLWSWPMVLVGQLAVALCFMELAAKFPVAGSVYNWSKKLGSRIVAWSAGWLMLTASVVTLSAVVLALQLNLPRLWSGFQFVGSGKDPHDFATNAVLLGAAMILFTTVINAIGVRLMAAINSSGVFIELIAACLIAILLAVHATRGPGVLFSSNGYGAGTPGGYLGVFLMASLASGYVMYGFDTASSLGEETVDPRRTAPAAILRAILASFVIGGAILLFAILAAPDLKDPQIATAGGGLQYIVEKLMWGPLGEIFLICIVIAVTVCSLAVHTAAIRLTFAMARDNALPFGEKLAHVNATTQTPITPSVVVGVIASGILLINLGQPQILTTLTSIAVIMIYLAYLMVTGPLLVQRLRGHWPPVDLAADGYFHMGRWGLPVNILAVVWGAGMALNLAWPRAEVYGTPWYNTWGAFVYIAIILGAGLLWYAFRGRHDIGTLASHAHVAGEAGVAAGGVPAGHRDLIGPAA
jgi:urea carboxylase system permease